MTMEKPDDKAAFFTMVFAGDIGANKGNPFHIETPYGKPVAIGRGNAFDEIEELRAALEGEG